MTKPGAPPYSPIVRAGDWLIVSGQIGLVSGEIVAGGVEGEFRQAVFNLKRCSSAKVRAWRRCARRRSSCATCATTR